MAFLLPLIPFGAQTVIATIIGDAAVAGMTGGFITLAKVLTDRRKRDEEKSILPALFYVNADSFVDLTAENVKVRTRYIRWLVLSPQLPRHHRYCTNYSMFATTAQIRDFC